jgi:hypothetical protein
MSMPLMMANWLVGELKKTGLFESGWSDEVGVDGSVIGYRVVGVEQLVDVVGP